jgi:hypothetical protein
MQTKKNKTTRIHLVNFNKNTSCRCVYNKGQKLLFVCDLVRQYGRGFVDKAQAYIKKERIKDASTNNSQMRRLITSSHAQQFLGKAS